MDKIARSAGTHDGTFHADEVTACALLLLTDLIDKDKIVRTRDPVRLEACEYVFDVGGLYDSQRRIFDHHQADYQGPLSSAGMILRYLLEVGKISENEYGFFNHSLILGIDAHDNGKVPKMEGFCSFSQVISNFAPIIYDAPVKEIETAFHQALDFAVGHLQRLRERYRYGHSCRDVVDKAMREGKNHLEFEQPIPWLENFFELGGADHPALYVIMPTGNQWKLRGIPPTLKERMQVRFPLPKEWAGLLENDFEKACGIKGAIFCHKERFISVWDTKEAVYEALNHVLQLARRA